MNEGKNMQKNITILGCTGSIGTQSLDVVRSQNYNIIGLAAHSNIDLLTKQINEFKPKYVAVVDENAFEKLCDKLCGTLNAPQLFKGKNGLVELAKLEENDIVLNSVVGIAGLPATLAALESGKNVALANKESLVAGGYLVTNAALANNAKLLPVDSEHSAIFQCLQDDNSAKSLEKIFLTASGGPFFGKNKNELENIKAKDALKHPNWAMGAKITIDSSTLMNKGLEFIEAAWLFGLKNEQIEIIVQRQSIIHSMVQFSDKSILAQLGVPDMRIPIQYALTWPMRTIGCAPELDFKTLKSITFDEADEEVFRCLPACKAAMEIGGLAPCAVNGANEEAVKLFLQDKISFLKIGELVEKTLQSENFGGSYTINDVYECDAMARKFVLNNI